MLLIEFLQKIKIFNIFYRLLNKRKQFRKIDDSGGFTPRLNPLGNSKIIDLLISKANYRSKKIVSFYITGGLGNQLFQIATVLAYGWKNSLIPIFEKVKESPSRVSPRPTYWNTVFKKISVSKYLPYRLVNFYEKSFTYQKIPPPDKIKNFYNSDGITFNSGFFQSAKYFDEFRERLLSCLFIIRASEKKFLKKKYLEIFNEEKITVSVHFRRGDNVTHPKLLYFPNLWDTDYYEKSIGYFQDKFGSENLKFVVISDGPIWAKEFMKINFPKLNLIFPHEKDYLDLYLMSCCKHQIISNSSFSWWAAYLNNNSEKIISAPKIWFGPEGPPNWDDIYMDGWIII